MDWSNESIIKFLELYASERVIWDPRDENHKSKHKVQDAWDRISINMDTSIDDLKAKKNSLMATFRSLTRKKKASIRSGIGVFQPIWFAYDLMESFLGTIYDLQETEDEIQQSEAVRSPSPPQENRRKTDPKTITNFDASRKRPKNTGFLVDEAQKKIIESFDTLNRVLKMKRVEEDECDIYGKLLAKKLRRYPENMRDRIMYKIDGLLLGNPYPDERPSSACSSSSSQSPYLFYIDSPTSPNYIVPNSPVKVPEGDEIDQNPIDIKNHTPVKTASRDLRSGKQNRKKPQ